MDCGVLGQSARLGFVTPRFKFPLCHEAYYVSLSQLFLMFPRAVERIKQERTRGMYLDLTGGKMGEKYNKETSSYIS